MSLDPVCDAPSMPLMRTRVNGAKAAHGNVAAFAAVAARERDARNALHGFGEVAVRELADVFRDDTVDGGGDFALLAERGIQ